VSKNPAGTLSRADASRLLSWENLGAQPASKAFLQSLWELALRPASFFDRMATSGGLREPLMFYWTMTTLLVVMSFPLALAHFGLTAPDASNVTAAAYNARLAAPRVTGFVTVLLPVALVAAGALALLCGTIFHLGARLFGAQDWEGCVSIWYYARSAWLAPFVLVEGLAAVMAIVCYLIALASPGIRGNLGSMTEGVMAMLGGVALVCGTAMMLIALVTGCSRAFKLDAAGGTAAAVAGLLAVTAVLVAPPVCWLHWGRRVGGGALGCAALLLIVLLVLGHVVTPKPSAEADKD
jgi:hypothetical protein